ncbi:MAG: DUF1697 domain-containing protein [Kordiimonas sp.]
MNKFIILLRGINVGGKNKVPMKELTKHLLEAGLAGVKTYIQSGNLVISTSITDRHEVTALVMQVIEQRFGFQVSAIALTLNEYSRALTNNPFKDAEDTPSTLHLSFLDTIPSDPDIEKLDNLKSNSERFKLNGPMFYLHAPDGVGRSKLAAGAEKAIGVPATARNWRSAQKILELAEQD